MNPKQKQTYASLNSFSSSFFPTKQFPQSQTRPKGMERVSQELLESLVFLDFIVANHSMLELTAKQQGREQEQK